jgi:hypothetical protein
VQGDKDALGFVGVDRIKQLKRAVRKAWESKGGGHFAITPGVRQTSVLFSYGVQVKFVDQESKEVMFFFLCCAHDDCVKLEDGQLLERDLVCVNHESIHEDDPRIVEQR